MIKIKENQMELSNEWRYYVTKDNKVIKAHLTLKEAESLYKRLTEVA